MSSWQRERLPPGNRDPRDRSPRRVEGASSKAAGMRAAAGQNVVKREISEGRRRAPVENVPGNTINKNIPHRHRQQLVKREISEGRRRSPIKNVPDKTNNYKSSTFPDKERYAAAGRNTGGAKWSGPGSHSGGKSVWKDARPARTFGTNGPNGGSSFGTNGPAYSKRSDSRRRKSWGNGRYGRGRYGADDMGAGGTGMGGMSTGILYGASSRKNAPTKDSKTQYSDGGGSSWFADDSKSQKGPGQYYEGSTSQFVDKPKMQTLGKKQEQHQGVFENGAGDASHSAFDPLLNDTFGEFDDDFRGAGPAASAGDVDDSDARKTKAAPGYADGWTTAPGYDHGGTSMGAGGMGMGGMSTGILYGASSHKNAPTKDSKTQYYDGGGSSRFADHSKMQSQKGPGQYYEGSSQFVDKPKMQTLGEKQNGTGDASQSAFDDPLLNDAFGEFDDDFGGAGPSASAGDVDDSDAAAPAVIIPMPAAAAPAAGAPVPRITRNSSQADIEAAALRTIKKEKDLKKLRKALEESQRDSQGSAAELIDRVVKAGDKELLRTAVGLVLAADLEKIATAAGRKTAKEKFNKPKLVDM